MLTVGVFFAFVNTVHAQSLDKILKGVGTILSPDSQKVTSSSGSQTKSVISGLIGGLIGTAKVTPSTLAGTWLYSEPAVAFESSNLLKKAGANVMAHTIESKLQTYLNKIGFTAGKVSITFMEDGNFSMKQKGKSITGTYTIEGSTLSLQRKGLLSSRPIVANVKVTGKEMQITFKADKLLNFITDFANGSSISSLQTIGKLASNVDGMQLGFKYTK